MGWNILIFTIGMEKRVKSFSQLWMDFCWSWELLQIKSFSSFNDDDNVDDSDNAFSLSSTFFIITMMKMIPTLIMTMKTRTIWWPPFNYLLLSPFSTSPRGQTEKVL